MSLKCFLKYPKFRNFAPIPWPHFQRQGFLNYFTLSMIPERFEKDQYFKNYLIDFELWPLKNHNFPKVAFFNTNKFENVVPLPVLIFYDSAFQPDSTSSMMLRLP